MKKSGPCFADQLEQLTFFNFGIKLLYFQFYTTFFTEGGGAGRFLTLYILFEPDLNIRGLLRALSIHTKNNYVRARTTISNI